MKPQNYVRRGIALVIVLCMIISVCPIMAFAAGTELKYVSLGDSMTNGYGLDGYLASDGTQVNGFRQVAPDAYPNQFANWLVANGYADTVDLQQLAISCTRAADLNFALRYDGTSDVTTLDYYDPITSVEFINNRYRDYRNVTGVDDTVDGGLYPWSSDPTLAYTKYYQDQVSDADIVSVAVGNSDFGVFMLRRLCSTLGMPGYGTVEDYIQTENIYTAGTPAMQAAAKAAQEGVKALLLDQGLAADAADKLSRVVLYTAENYMVRYDQAIQAIVELNPDVELILVGLMNNMNGVKVSAPVLGEGVVLDMGKIMGASISAMNAYLAGLPVLLQELGEYPDATIYFAPCGDIQVFTAQFAAGNTAAYPVVRARVMTAVKDLGVITMTGTSAEVAAVGAYETARNELFAADDATRAAKLGALATVANEEIITYYGMEKAMENAASLPMLDGGAILTVPTALADPSTLFPTAADIGSAVAASVAANPEMLAAAFEVVAAATSTPVATVQYVYENNADATVVATVDGMMAAVFAPDAMQNLIGANDTLNTLMNLFGRFVAGDGIGSHPDAIGHDAITASIVNVYGNHITAKDLVIGEAKAAAEALYQFVQDHPEAIGAVAYYAAKEAGMTDEQINTVVTEAQAAYNAYVNNDMDAVRANCNAIAAYIEATYPDEVAAAEQAIADATAAYEQVIAKYNELVETLTAAQEALPGEIEAAKAAAEAAAAEFIDAAVAAAQQFGEQMLAAIEQHIEEKLPEVQQYVEEKLAELEEQLAPIVEEIEAQIEEAYNKAVEIYEQLSDLTCEDIKDYAEQMLEELLGDLPEEIQAKVEEGIAHVEEKWEEICAECEELPEEALAKLEELLNEYLGEYLDEEDISEFVDTLRNTSIETVEQDMVDYHTFLQEKYESVKLDATQDEYALIKDANYYVALGADTVAADGSYYELLKAALEAAYNDPEDYGYVLDGANLGQAGLQSDEVLAYIAANATEIGKADLITYQMDAGAFIKAILSEEEPDWSVYFTEEQLNAIAEALPVVQQFLTDDWTRYADMDAAEIVNALEEPVMNFLSQDVQKVFDDNEAMLDALLVAAADAVKTAISELQAQIAAVAQQVDAFVDEAFAAALNELSKDYVSYANAGIENAAAQLADKLAETIPTAEELEALGEAQIRALLELCAQAAVDVHEQVKGAELDVTLNDEQQLAFNLVFPVVAQVYLDHWAADMIPNMVNGIYEDIEDIHNDIYAEIEAALAEECPFDHEVEIQKLIDEAVAISEDLVDEAITNAQSAAINAVTLVKDEYDEIADAVAAVLAEDWAEYVGQNAEAIAEAICGAVAEKLSEGSAVTAALVNGAADALEGVLAPVIAKAQEILAAAQAQKDQLNSVITAVLGSEFTPYLNKAVYAAVAYVVNTNKAIDAIRELNADAALVVVGMYNPLQDVAVNYDGTVYDLGAYLDCVVDATNFYYSALAFADCLKTENYVAFVPVTDTTIAFEPLTVEIDSTRPLSDLNYAQQLVAQLNALLNGINGTDMFADDAGQAYIESRIFTELLSEVDALYVTIPATAVAMDPETLTLTVGGTADLAYVLEPVNTTDTVLSIVWESSNTGVVTVDENGKITAVGAGTATITVTVTTESGTFTATCEVTVNAPVTPPPAPAPVEEGYAKCPQDETCILNKYTDVDVKAWYHDGAHYCVEHNLMIGISDTLFAPYGTTTRGMVAVIIYRLAGEPAYTNENIFADVAEGSWYEDAIVWANGEGVLLGYGNGNYGPEDAVTREQLATILYRYAKLVGIDTAKYIAKADMADFEDADEVSTWAAEGMKFCVGAGILEGYADLIRPVDYAIRAEAAAMYQRFCQYVLGL